MCVLYIWMKMLIMIDLVKTFDDVVCIVYRMRMLLAWFENNTGITGKGVCFVD